MVNNNIGKFDEFEDIKDDLADINIDNDLVDQEILHKSSSGEYDIGPEDKFQTRANTQPNPPLKNDSLSLQGVSLKGQENSTMHP